MSEYAKSGVDIGAKMAIIKRIKSAVNSTHSAAVLGGVGSFGGLFQLDADTILVASTDGIGTKTMLAAQTGRYRGLGHDIVNHCVNDILCQGAHPLFFMDYIAASRLDQSIIVTLIEGMAEACRAANCALLGGETAEMPGVYQPDQFDVAGTIVGVVNARDRLPTTDIEAGDVLIGLESSGPHTNGFSLIRRVLTSPPNPLFVYREWEQEVELVEAALAPHRSYLPHITAIRGQFTIKALAHITGGGFYDNIPRVLPNGLGVQIDLGSWPIPTFFTELARRGNVPEAEMYHVFNMGIGMIVIASPEQAATIMTAPLEFPRYRIGQVVKGSGVRL